MDEPSLETRYGSFCAIRHRRDVDNPLFAHDLGTLKLYQVPSTAPPAVVVSLREAPEVVLFGTPAALQIASFLREPGGLLLMPEPTQPGKIKISRFAAGEEDQRTIVDAAVDSVVAGIVEVGGKYGDVVAVLRMAKEKGYLIDQLAIDPLPKPLRTYHRDAEDGEDQDSAEESDAELVLTSHSAD